jgi:hypothetical protein
MTNTDGKVDFQVLEAVLGPGRYTLGSTLTDPVDV